MLRKTIYLAVIFIAFYANLLINYPCEEIKSWGYNQLLTFYAMNISNRYTIDIVYNPGIRKLGYKLSDIKAYAVIPDGNSDFAIKADRLLADNCQAVIECSAMDTWHTTTEGRLYLQKLRNRAYRVVVFDGGHHLPTLGMVPDIILIPQLNGYAVHSYMLDGIKVAKLIDIARESYSDSVIAVVPRWALVKNKESLTAITEQILANLSYRESSADPFIPCAQSRISKYNGVIFAYINSEYSNNTDLLVKRLLLLGIHDVKKVYLAFDYNYIDIKAAQDYANDLSTRIKLPVSRVNEPVKVFNVFWGGR